MKKLSIEEKARAYDEATKVIKDNLNALNEITEMGAEVVNIQSIKNCFYRAFQELKEIEDERIRKELLEHCINRRDGKQVCVDASDYRRWADWLFKQGVENIPNVKSDKEISNEIIKFLELPHPQFVGKRHQEEWIAWLEKQDSQILANSAKTCESKQTPYWSKEDENEMNHILSVLEDKQKEQEEKGYNNLIHTDSWLRSIKDRVQQQQKPVWNEEDEEMIDNIIDYMMPMPIFFESTKGKSGKEYTKEFIKNATNWLKLLKDRVLSKNTWKPSEEQMHYLYWIANVKLGDSVVEQEVSKHLIELHENLKKLKENKL